jgi:hypothetical protein
MGFMIMVSFLNSIYFKPTLNFQIEVALQHVFKIKIIIQIRFVLQSVPFLIMAHPFAFGCCLETLHKLDFNRFKSIW